MGAALGVAVTRHPTPPGATLLCTAAFRSVSLERPVQHTSLITQRGTCSALPLSLPAAHGKGPALPPGFRGKGRRAIALPLLPEFRILNTSAFALWLSRAKGWTVSGFSPRSPSDSFGKLYLRAPPHAADLDGAGAGARHGQEVQNHHAPSQAAFVAVWLQSGRVS